MAARRVENKVIVVTGAKSGIGRVTALMLAQQGAKLGLLDLVSPDEVAEEITRASGVAMALQCDVCSSEEVETAIQAICQQYGPLDGRCFLSHPRALTNPLFILIGLTV